MLVLVVKQIALDCNVWIEILTNPNDKLRNVLFNKDSEYQIILSSYMIVEILKVLKRLASKFNISSNELERLFWDFTRKKNIQLNFDNTLSDALINEVKNRSEILVLAKVLDLEPKDVPYIIVAFNNKSIVITQDERSIINKRNFIKEKLEIEILTISEFIASLGLK